MKKTKSLNKEAMLKNINGLSLGDRAYCGPYGTIRCTHTAVGVIINNLTNKAGNHRGMHMSVSNTRKFSVSGNTNGILQNRGNYTMKQLREAIVNK